MQGVNQGVTALGDVANNLKRTVPEAAAVLRKMDELYGEQVQRLKELSAAVAEIERTAATTGGLLGTTADQLSKSLVKFEALPTQLHASLESGLNALLSATAEQLTITLKQFEALPESLRTSVDAALGEVKKDLPPIWKEATAGLRQEVLNVIQGVRTESDAASAKLKEAASQLQDVGNRSATVLDVSFDKALTKVKEGAREQLLRLDHIFVQRFPEVLGKMDQLATGLGDVVSRLEGARIQVTELLTEIKAVQKPEGPFGRLEEISREVLACSDGIAKLSRTIGTSDRRTVLLALREMEDKVVSRMDRLVAQANQRGLWNRLKAHLPWRMVGRA